ncbi:membrane protein [Streptococcus australis]|uniref:Membrane protein n=1 Tax=Streptococcus australis TaxID=113107 RepID=A0A4V0BWE9_9STRE|nr:P-loop NTPase fold protein [Streptococcus australis]VTS70981.1 membrane protein [Streptococcus australis]
MENHLLNSLASLLHINKSSNENSNVKLESLAPIDYTQIASDEFETNYYKIYKDVLNNVTQDKLIKNVGVTGGYGTGKSSIIHSYFNELKSKTSIYISLAHFDSLAGNTIPTSQDDKAINSQIDNILEMKIVNQLVNQIKPNKIPKANFLTKKISKIIKFSFIYY